MNFTRSMLSLPSLVLATSVAIPLSGCESKLARQQRQTLEREVWKLAETQAFTDNHLGEYLQSVDFDYFKDRFTVRDEGILLAPDNLVTRCSPDQFAIQNIDGRDVPAFGLDTSVTCQNDPPSIYKASKYYELGVGPHLDLEHSLLLPAKGQIGLAHVHSPAGEFDFDAKTLSISILVGDPKSGYMKVDCSTQVNDVQKRDAGWDDTNFTLYYGITILSCDESDRAQPLIGQKFMLNFMRRKPQSMMPETIWRTEYVGSTHYIEREKEPAPREPEWSVSHES